MGRSVDACCCRFANLLSFSFWSSDLFPIAPARYSASSAVTRIDVHLMGVALLSSYRGVLTALLLAASTATALGQAAMPAPVAAKLPVTDEYHGVKVVDDYRWLENGKSAETEQWVAVQNAHSLHYS